MILAWSKLYWCHLGLICMIWSSISWFWLDASCIGVIWVWFIWFELGVHDTGLVRMDLFESWFAQMVSAPPHRYSDWAMRILGWESFRCHFGEFWAPSWGFRVQVGGLGGPMLGLIGIFGRPRGFEPKLAKCIFMKSYSKRRSQVLFTFWTWTSHDL